MAASSGSYSRRSVAARDVTAMLPLASGDLLIGTRQAGLLLFNGKTLTVFHPALANLNITALARRQIDAGAELLRRRIERTELRQYFRTRQV